MYLQNILFVKPHLGLQVPHSSTEYQNNIIKKKRYLLLQMAHLPGWNPSVKWITLEYEELFIILPAIMEPVDSPLREILNMLEHGKREKMTHNKMKNKNIIQYYLSYLNLSLLCQSN